MASERKLTVVLAGDAKGLVSALDTADKRVGGFGSKLSGKAKVAMAGAATAVTAFAGTSIQAFVDAEESQAQLAAAFDKFPQLAGGNIDALRGLNTELAKKTKFDDDATASGQSVLAQFGLTQDQLLQMTPLLQDYAARTGKDLPTAAKDLGKAIQGQGKALKGVGINFKDTGSNAGNLEELMGGLNDKVGGFASSQGKTAAGQAAILKNQFGELQETVGSALVPALLKMSTFITTKVLPAVQGIGGWLADHKPVLIAVAAVIGVGLVAAFVAWAAAAASAAAATLAAAAPVLLIAAAIAALVAGVIWAYQNWGFFRNAVDAVASFITGTLWPVLQAVAGWITGTLIPTIGAIIGTFLQWGGKVGEVSGKIIGYVAGVISWVRTNWPLILAILTGPIGLAVLAISRNWDTIKSGVTAVKKWIVDRFNDVTSFLKGIPGAFGSALSGAADMIKRPFESAFSAIKRLWNSTVGGFGFSVPGWVPFAGGKSFHIPEMALGGVVKASPGGTIVRLGEGGRDEAVIPLGRQTSGTPTGDTVVNLTVDLRGSVGVDGPAVEKWVRTALQNAVSRDGKVPGTNIVRTVA